MHREIKGTGNQYMDRFEEAVKDQVHKKRVTIARHHGNSELTNSMFDPNVFILGTEYSDKFNSVHKRNHAKTLLLKEQRYSEIERENRILFDKMSSVKNRKLNFVTLQTSTGKTSPSPMRPNRPIFKKTDPLELLTASKSLNRRLHQKKLQDENA